MVRENTSGADLKNYWKEIQDVVVRLGGKKWEKDIDELEDSTTVNVVRPGFKLTTFRLQVRLTTQSNAVLPKTHLLRSF